MHLESAGRAVIQGGERRGRIGRCRDIWPVGEHQVDAVGLSGDMGGDDRRVGGPRVVGEEDAVPAVVLVGPGQLPGVVEIQAAALPRRDLAGRVGAGDSEKLNGHGGSPVIAANPMLVMSRKVLSGWALGTTAE